MPLVLDRPLSSARTWLHGILGLLCWSPGPIMGLLMLLGLYDPILDTISDWAALVTLQRTTATWGTVILLLLSPIFLQAWLLTRARYHHGWCELREDGATFLCALDSPGDKRGTTSLTWPEVESWEARDDVVLVRQRGRGRLNRVCQPLVIPTANEQEQLRVVALLEQPPAGKSIELGH